MPRLVPVTGLGDTQIVPDASIKAVVSRKGSVTVTIDGPAGAEYPTKLHVHYCPPGTADGADPATYMAAPGKTVDVVPPVAPATSVTVVVPPSIGPGSYSVKVVAEFADE